jgi:hypothetical protein
MLQEVYENGDIFSLNWNRSMFNMADFLKNYKYKYIYIQNPIQLALTYKDYQNMYFTITML